MTQNNPGKVLVRDTCGSRLVTAFLEGFAVVCDTDAERNEVGVKKE